MRQVIAIVMIILVPALVLSFLGIQLRAYIERNNISFVVGVQEPTVIEAVTIREKLDSRRDAWIEMYMDEDGMSEEDAESKLGSAFKIDESDNSYANVFKALKLIANIGDERNVVMSGYNDNGYHITHSMGGGDSVSFYSKNFSLYISEDSYGNGDFYCSVKDVPENFITRLLDSEI